MADTYEQMADGVADAYQIPRSLFRALIQQESGWNAYAIGQKGEIGLTQLMPTTATELGVNAWDPMQNLKGGAAYLASQFKRFGNWATALAAYNGGPGGTDKAAAKEYATEVLHAQKELQKANPKLDQTPAAPADPGSSPGEQDWYHGSVLEQLVHWVTGGPKSPSPDINPPANVDEHGLAMPTPEQSADFGAAAATVGKYAGASILVVVSIGIALYVLAVRGKDAAVGTAQKTIG